MRLFSESHTEFRLRVREFVECRIAPYSDGWEEARTCPLEIFRELGSFGWLGVTQPEDYGGLGLDFGYNVVLAEELVGCKSMGITLSLLAQTNFFQPLLTRYGTEEQKRKFLEPSIRGTKIGALASTEPSGGSDIVNATQCRAEEDGDFWIVSGEKKYITNGPIADFVVTLVRSRDEAGPNTLSLIVIPSDTPGFRVKATLRKLGLHTSPTGWLEFDHCRVSKANILGKANLGYYYHTQNLLEERLIGGVAAAAAAALVLDETIAHLRRRVAYGNPLTQLQTVRHRISEMAAELEMAKRFVYSVCESFRDGRVEAREICMIKFQVVDIVQRIVERCLQLHGGAGFLEESWISRMYRDVRVLSIGGGVSEAMKDLVASYMRL